VYNYVLLMMLKDDLFFVCHLHLCVYCAFLSTGMDDIKDRLLDCGNTLLPSNTECEAIINQEFSEDDEGDDVSSDSADRASVEVLLRIVSIKVRTEMIWYMNATIRGECSVLPQSHLMEFLLDQPGDRFALYDLNNRASAHVLDTVELRLGFETSYRCLICSLHANGDRKTGKNSFCNIMPVNICEHLSSVDHLRRRFRLHRV
jgi:hypothetical protein